MSASTTLPRTAAIGTRSAAYRGLRPKSGPSWLRPKNSSATLAAVNTARETHAQRVAGPPRRTVQTTSTAVASTLSTHTATGGSTIESLITLGHTGPPHSPGTALRKTRLPTRARSPVEPSASP